MSISGISSNSILVFLALIWVGFLRVRFEVGEVKIPPSSFLKLVRIMLESSNLPRNMYTHITHTYVNSGNRPASTRK